MPDLSHDSLHAASAGDVITNDDYQAISGRRDSKCFCGVVRFKSSQVRVPRYIGRKEGNEVCRTQREIRSVRRESLCENEMNSW